MGKREMKKFLKQRPHPPRNSDKGILIEGTPEEQERYNRRVSKSELSQYKSNYNKRRT